MYSCRIASRATLLLPSSDVIDDCKSMCSGWRASGSASGDDSMPGGRYDDSPKLVSLSLMRNTLVLGKVAVRGTAVQMMQAANRY